MTSRFASVAPLLTKAERGLLSQARRNERNLAPGATTTREVLEVLFFELDATLRPTGVERARELAALVEGGRSESARSIETGRDEPVSPPSASATQDPLWEEAA
jgi:hypothetical protein